MSLKICIECGYSHGRHSTGCPEDVDYSDDDTPAIHEGRVARFEVDDDVDIVRGGVTLKGCHVLEVASDPLHDVTGRITNAGKSAKYKVSGYPHWAYDWQLERSA